MLTSVIDRNATQRQKMKQCNFYRWSNVNIFDVNRNEE